MASHDRRLNTYADILSGLPRATSELWIVSTYASSIKPALDFILAVLIVIPAAFLVGIFALLVMLDGHNPFYRQTRIGKNGRAFEMWKLRSMVPNAEAVLESYFASDPEARKEWDLTQKLKNDPRITVIGRLIQLTRITKRPLETAHVFDLCHQLGICRDAIRSDAPRRFKKRIWFTYLINQTEL